MSKEFGKGDIRRTLAVVAVISEQQPVTLNQLVEATEMPKGTVQEQLKKLSAGQIPGINLVKAGSAYSIENITEIFKINNLKKWYKSLVKDC